MSRRLITDAKIVLERAGYKCNYFSQADSLYYSTEEQGVRRLVGLAGTVDNEEVVRALAERGYNSFGYKETVNVQS